MSIFCFVSSWRILSWSVCLFISLTLWVQILIVSLRFSFGWFLLFIWFLWLLFLSGVFVFLLMLSSVLLRNSILCCFKKSLTCACSLESNLISFGLSLLLFLWEPCFGSDSKDSVYSLSSHSLLILLAGSVLLIEVPLGVVWEINKSSLYIIQPGCHCRD
jgi:hypothetical protein